MRKLKILAILAVAGLLSVSTGAFAGPFGWLQPRTQQPVGEFYSVTTTADYRPVDVPGTERRAAQNDAENKARKAIYEHVGSLHLANGHTVNDVLVHDARLKAKLLEVVRNSEVVDWRVSPQCGQVQVWMRLDMGLARAVLAQCGYR
jgi:hypothetical protein